MTDRLAKSLALRIPPIRRLYQELLDRNDEIARLRGQNPQNSNAGDLHRRIAQLERDVIWRDRQLEAMRQLGERINQPGTSKIEDLGEQYDVIFVTQDPRRIAPARARCYNFAEILQQNYGLKTRVLSFVDHLGMPDLGSGPVDFITDDVKLRLNADAMRYLLRHPKAVFYVQKTGYHFLSVLGAAGFNGNRVILDLDDHDFHHNSWPQLDKYLPSFRTPEAHVAMMEASAAVVVASHEIRKTLEERGVSPFFLPTVPDLQRFSPSDNFKKVLPNTDKVRIWWGGDVFGHVFDNVVLAFEHIASMPQQTREKIEVVLCGYGDTYYLLAKHLKERFSGAFQLTELGAIAPDDMPALLSEIDIGFIMFNKWSNFDTYKSPTKMFELMAMGKAVIAERCGEPTHIISDGIDGFLAQGRDEWAAKMALLVDSAAMRKAMGKKARSKIEGEYSLQVTMPILHEIIERVRTAPPGRIYAPKSFGDVPHRNTVSKVAPTVSMQMSQLDGQAAHGATPDQPAARPGLNRRMKLWMVDNLPPGLVGKLRAVNKTLRI